MLLDAAGFGGAGALRDLVVARPHRRPIAERLERGAELGADLADVLLEPALLGGGLARDPPPFGVSLLDDEVRLAASLRLHVLRRPLGRDERRAQERLELAVLLGLGLELVEAVGEVGALAPDLLEAVAISFRSRSTSAPAVAARKERPTELARV